MPKLFAGVLLVLSAMLFVEQALLRRRPAWLARLAFVPMTRRPLRLGERARARLSTSDDRLDPLRLALPADVGRDDLELTPPSAEGPGWARLRATAGKNIAGVARLVVRDEQGTLVVRLDYYPATLAWALGVVVLFSTLIVALAPWHVGIVLTAIVAAMWLAPSLSVLERARGRLAELAEKIAEAAEREEEPGRRTDRPTKGRGRRRK